MSKYRIIQERPNGRYKIQKRYLFFFWATLKGVTTCGSMLDEVYGSSDEAWEWLEYNVGFTDNFREVRNNGKTRNTCKGDGLTGY